MGGDDSQKVLPWRGSDSSPGRSQSFAYNKIRTLTENSAGGPCSCQIKSSSLALPSNASRRWLQQWIRPPRLRSTAPAGPPWYDLASRSVPASRPSRRLQEPSLRLRRSLPCAVAKPLSRQHTWLEMEIVSCHRGSSTTPSPVLLAHSHPRSLHCGCDPPAPDLLWVSSLSSGYCILLSWIIFAKHTWVSFG